VESPSLAVVGRGSWIGGVPPRSSRSSIHLARLPHDRRNPRRAAGIRQHRLHTKRNLLVRQA